MAEETPGWLKLPENLERRIFSDYDDLITAIRKFEPNKIIIKDHVAGNYSIFAVLQNREMTLKEREDSTIRYIDRRPLLKVAYKCNLCNQYILGAPEVKINENSRSDIPSPSYTKNCFNCGDAIFKATKRPKK